MMGPYIGRFFMRYVVHVVCSDGHAAFDFKNKKDAAKFQSEMLREARVRGDMSVCVSNPVPITKYKKVALR